MVCQNCMWYAGSRGVSTRTYKRQSTRGSIFSTLVRRQETLRFYYSPKILAKVFALGSNKLLVLRRSTTDFVQKGNPYLIILIRN